MKITKIADGAYFVPSYSEQTIVRAYSTETTVQSFAYGDEFDASEASEERAPAPPTPNFVPQVRR